MQKFTNLLNSSSELKNFIHKLDMLAQLNQALTSKLDKTTAENCRVSNLRNGTLILTTSSPAWNHKLRFQSIDLLSALRMDPRWSGLVAIEVKVDYLPPPPFSNSHNPQSAVPNNISMANASVIKQMAEGIKHKKLAESLIKLASKR